MAHKKDIKSMNIPELSELIESMGEPGFRAKQIFRWLSRGVKSFDEMTDLPAKLRNELSDACRINVLEIEEKQISRRDGTIKYLWRLFDGNFIESVIMQYRHGNTACISAQVGCRMGCSFCASAAGGLIRNLEPSEMLDQITFSKYDSGLKISNIVLMGIGEPLDNFTNVIRFLELVNSDDGLNVGMRHISLSTCGLADRIDELSEMGLQLTLSVSLHSAEDGRRSALMPVNKIVGLDRLISSCKNYYSKTGRRVSFEYAMIDGENDGAEAACKLAGLLNGLPCHINLIPVNKVREDGFRAPGKKAVSEFKKILEDRNFAVTVRRSLGGDIDAACGQLRRRKHTL